MPYAGSGTLSNPSPYIFRPQYLQTGGESKANPSKFTTGAAVPVISFNTGTTADSAGVQATSQAIMIPAGVLNHDVALVCATNVVLTGTPSTLSIGSTGTAPVQIGTTVTGSNGLPASIASAVYYIICTATDAGKVVTVSASASGFWAVSLAAWTGVSNVGPIDVSGSAFGGPDTPSVTCPVKTTTLAGDWAVFCSAGTAQGNSNSTITVPAGSTSRANHVSSSSVGAAIADSNASVGGSGTSIGGGTFTCITAANSMLAGFTVGLAA